MDIQKIKQLVELLKDSGVAELEIREGEESLRITRQLTQVPAQTIVQLPEPLPTAAPVAAAAPVPAPPPAVVAKPEAEGHVIKSPMVGTFYPGPSPSSPPFMQIGKPVKKGDIVCIIEAMKVMNQIESDADGVIASVNVESGHPVEYGQPLFTVK